MHGSLVSAIEAVRMDWQMECRADSAAGAFEARLKHDESSLTNQQQFVASRSDIASTAGAERRDSVEELIATRCSNVEMARIAHPRVAEPREALPGGAAPDDDALPVDRGQVVAVRRPLHERLRPGRALVHLLGLAQGKWH